MSICEVCEKLFTCGLLEGDSSVPCWCSQLPVLPGHKLGRAGARCYCQDCLTLLINSSTTQPVQSTDP